MTIFVLSCQTPGTGSVSKSTVAFGNINEYTRKAAVYKQ